jgi:hypothetical protein
VDLSFAVVLGAARHTAPSTIGIDTIYRSKAQIPESFLRVVAYRTPLLPMLSPWFVYRKITTPSSSATRLPIKTLPNVSMPISKPRAFAVWFAPHDIKGGRKLPDQIDEAMRLHDKLLLTLSPNSMKSEWVKTEISKAREREIRDKARVLFPVRLVPFEVLREWECFDSDAGKNSAREIREYFVPDFRGWKNHDSYRKALDWLVADLQAPAVDGPS